jgi:hypothetical protein
MLQMTLKMQSSVNKTTIGGRELRSVGQRKEKDLLPYDARRAQGNLRLWLGCKRKEEKRGGEETGASGGEKRQRKAKVVGLKIMR